MTSPLSFEKLIITLRSVCKRNNKCLVKNNYSGLKVHANILIQEKYCIEELFSLVACTLYIVLWANITNE